jgi:N-acetylmuramoyl-L-alanine amidase
MIRPGWLAAGVALAVGTIALLVSKTVGKNRPALPNCSTQYTAHGHGSTRNMQSVRLIVLHSTEGATAAGAAGWFANPDSQGSTQIIVDDTSCFRTLPDNVIPWGAAGGRANEDGLHIEMAGFAKWTRAEWLKHQATLDKTAAWIAEWSALYGVPLTFLTAADLKRDGLKARGITTHAAITEAFKPGGHTDPGKNFPIDVVMRAAGGSVPNVA